MTTEELQARLATACELLRQRQYRPDESNPARMICFVCGGFEGEPCFEECILAAVLNGENAE